MVQAVRNLASDHDLLEQDCENGEHHDHPDPVEESAPLELAVEVTQFHQNDVLQRREKTVADRQAQQHQQVENESNKRVLNQAQRN